MYCSSSMSCWSDHARAWASGQIHTWVSNVNLVPAIRSSSNSFVFLFLNAAIATIHQLNYSTRLSYPETDTIVPARKTDLHLGLEVAFAFAFLVSSSICFWIWSSLFSSINNWLLNSTIAFLADSLWSLRPPPNQPIQDIVVVYLAKGEGGSLRARWILHRSPRSTSDPLDDYCFCVTIAWWVNGYDKGWLGDDDCELYAVFMWPLSQPFNGIK